MGLNISLVKNHWLKLKANLNLPRPAIGTLQPPVAPPQSSEIKLGETELAQTQVPHSELPLTELTQTELPPLKIVPSAPEPFNIDKYRKELEKKIEQEYSQIFTNYSPKSWDFLISNANNGRTHAHEASNILKRTMGLIDGANLSINEMLLSTIDISDTIAALQTLSDEIKLLSDNSKIVSLNAYVEAAKAADKGKTFSVVANELGALSGNIKRITNNIQTSLTTVDEKVIENKNTCFDVADLFLNFDEEMKQINKLMMRIEELSVSQSEPFDVFETQMNPKVKKNASRKVRPSATPQIPKKVA